MAETPTRGDLARAEILDAARRLFIAQGYHGTSMRAIAHAAGGRAVAGLYNHFPTKEAIFAALIEERHPYDEMLLLLEDIAGQAQTAPEFLRAALAGLMSLMPQHYDFLQLVQIDLREFGGRTLGHVIETRVFPRVLAVIERLQGLPGLKPVAPSVWIRLIASLVIGYVVTEQLGIFAPFRQHTQDEWATLFADALLNGLATDGR